MQPVNNDIGHILNSNASTICYVNISPTPIDCFKTVHDQFLFQLYDHVALEHDPEGFVLDDSVAECPRAGVDGVIVRGVCDNVKATVAASDGAAPKADAAVRQALAIAVPVRVAPPAIVNRVSGTT